MAQLYKMTLYICDLEENLSFDEIKTLIDERALSGISVNALCHFADEQIGEQIEWDDDVDINRCDCPTSAWDKYFKSKTNADHIRAMSDEELAKMINAFNDYFGMCNRSQIEVACMGCELHDVCCLHRGEALDWLRQPAKDGDGE